MNPLPGNDPFPTPERVVLPFRSMKVTLQGFFGVVDHDGDGVLPSNSHSSKSTASLNSPVPIPKSPIYKIAFFPSQLIEVGEIICFNRFCIRGLLLRCVYRCNVDADDEHNTRRRQPDRTLGHHHPDSRTNVNRNAFQSVFQRPGCSYLLQHVEAIECFFYPLFFWFHDAKKLSVNVFIIISRQQYL